MFDIVLLIDSRSIRTRTTNRGMRPLPAGKQGGTAVKKTSQETVVCQICGKPKRPTEVVMAGLVRDPIAEIIRRSRPDWSAEGYICQTDLNAFRSQHVRELLESEKGELTALEQDVLQSLKEHELISENINVAFGGKRSLGERLADHIAEFGGSWRFILSFAGLCLGWIAFNSIHLFLVRPVDPYPFILLNLMLSCLAAIQAPIIMMSQNRQEAKDRLRSEHDYRVNLKAELEIRHLHEKVDHLLQNQWQKLMDIQEMQMELLEELNTASRRGTQK
jgi:uncharacterized membrane protein